MARHAKSHFEDLAISFVNLESPLDAEGLPPQPICGLGQLLSAPGASLEYLTAVCAHTVGTANNHSYNFGDVGTERMRRAISQRGMISLGAARSLQDPLEVFVWQGSGNIRVGFWPVAKTTSDPSTRKSAGVGPATIDRASQALAAMKDQGARFCIALLHAGCMRTNRLEPEGLRLVDRLAKRGFDFLTASHSHRISGSNFIVGRGKTASIYF
jgi:poly-gamma-glutamate capsule biosynthesis protein CapA/YwtB (metallophosphatase superfamily)